MSRTCKPPPVKNSIISVTRNEEVAVVQSERAKRRMREDDAREATAQLSDAARARKRKRQQRKRERDAIQRKAARKAKESAEARDPKVRAQEFFLSHQGKSTKPKISKSAKAKRDKARRSAEVKRKNRRVRKEAEKFRL